MTDQAEPEFPDNSWLNPRSWIIVTGGVLAALGLIVWVGWHTHTTTLIRPDLLPMQYNTAAGFLLSGLMLLAHAHDLRRAEITLAAILATIGILTLVEYILAVDLGIDQLLMKYDITVQASHPGRMAPNAALSFSLTGIAILLSAGLMRRLAASINGILGSLVLGLGVVALLGYFVGLEAAFGWGQLTRMAIHTAAGFIVLGLGLLVSGWRIARDRNEILPRWLPIFAAIAVLTITISLWRAVDPERDTAALQNARDFVFFFGIVLAAVLAWVVSKAVSERAGKDNLEVEIAERKQVAEKLHNYEHIVSNSTDMLALLDKNYVYLTANAAYLKAFGKTSDEMIGRTLAEVFGEEFFSTVIRPNAERCLAGEEVHYQARFEYPASGWRHVDAIYSPYRGTDNEIRGFVIISRDITEHEQLQAQLRQAQKLEAVGQLTGGIAHDFNNLLTIIIGNLQLLEESSSQDQGPHANTQDALDAALRGAELTRRLLAFSRKQLLVPKVIDINELVTELEPLFHRTLGEDISIKTKLAGDLWLTCVDHSQLENSLVNLAVNARDAMSSGGKLTIETSNTFLDEDYARSHTEVSPGEYVRLRVSDNGTGMPKDVLARVFEPFFSTKEPGKGTGLGLSMVYGFVKQSAGHINIYSEEGHGTTITIYLPKSQSATEKTGITSSRLMRIPSGNETVLLVEDEAGVRKIGVTLLTALGYRVLEAGAGPEALALLEQHDDIDLLFTDMVMPGGMTGAELGRQARERKPTLKVLYTSGYTDTAAFGNGLLQHGDDILNKPYQKRELAQKVRDILDQG